MRETVSEQQQKRMFIVCRLLGDEHTLRGSLEAYATNSHAFECHLCRKSLDHIRYFVDSIQKSGKEPIDYRYVLASLYINPYFCVVVIVSSKAERKKHSN